MFDNSTGGINIGKDTTDISLKTDNNISETISIYNTQGTENNAISLIANLGGIDLNAKKEILIDSEESINLISSYGSLIFDCADNIDLKHNGTTMIKINDNESIFLKENSPILITHSSKKNNDNLTISQKGNTKSSLILSSEGSENNAIKLNSTKGGIDVQANNNILMDAINGTFSISAGNASNFTTKKGILTLQGNNGVDLKYSNVSVLKISSNNTVTMKNNNPVKITHRSTSNAKDFTISQTGKSNSSLILSSEGTGTDALLMKTLYGGITINSFDGLEMDVKEGDFQLETQSGEINIESSNSLSLTSNASSNFTTTTGELTLGGESGVDLNYNGTSVLKLTDDNTITLRANNPVSITHSSNSSSKDFTISQKGSNQSNLIMSSEGTSQNSIKIISSAGGITNQFASNKTYTIKNSNNDMKITLTDDSSTPINEKIELINTNGTATNAINLITYNGGITICSSQGIKLDGNVETTGTTSFTSDKRLKNNISKFHNALETILKFEGVNFTWKNDKEEEKQYGFIAQNIQEILPELVKTNINDRLSVNYIAMIPILVEAIKEQQNIINKIKEKSNIII